MFYSILFRVISVVLKFFVYIFIVYTDVHTTVILYFSAIIKILYQYSIPRAKTLDTFGLYSNAQVRVSGLQLERGVRREVARWLESGCVPFKSRTTELKFRVDVGRLSTTERVEHVHVSLEKGDIKRA